MPLIAFSKGNPAGEAIAAKLVENSGFEPQPQIASGDEKFEWNNWKNPGGLQLVEITTMHIFADYLAYYPLFNETDLLVFASTHKSAKGVPSLTVHTPGNFTGENILGGNPSQLALGSAKAIKCGYGFLRKPQNRVPGFEAAIEATHHGPSALSCPVMFAEVGSTENEWGNEAAARKAAECIMHVCGNWRREPVEKYAVGFGGPHYLEKFARLVEEKNWGFAHTASRHTAAKMGEGMAGQAVEKTLEGAQIGVVEKKSFTAAQREKVLGEIAKAGLEAIIV
ncbi:MAG: D-aminoacyl-tRNA deacylase [Candidatus Micrarchaeota archaeon]